MNERFQTRLQAPWVTATPVWGHLLQRKCACGGAPAAGSECQECEREAAHLLHRSVSEGGNGASSSVLDDWRAAAQPADRVRPGFLDPGFTHSFSKVRVEASDRAGRSSENRDSFRDTDEIHRPLIEDFRRREGLPLSGVDKSGDRVGPSDAEIKYQGLALPCPTSTEVEARVDLTPGALSAGYLSAYGIMAKMRVRPDQRTWDGTKIAESLTEVPGTCPSTLTRPGPCEGGPPFTVGAPTKGSSVQPAQPGLINRFYDFHRSRSTTISFLHDKTRNPAGLNSCQTSCKQEYSCDGKVIGRHLITRTFRKGTHAGKDVTIVDVTKT